MKKCTQCGELKPISDFHKRSVAADGHEPRHVWLLPQFVCNGKSKLSIRNTLTNLFKYKQYELDRECLNVTSSV